MAQSLVVSGSLGSTDTNSVSVSLDSSTGDVIWAVCINYAVRAAPSAGDANNRLSDTKNSLGAWDYRTPQASAITRCTLAVLKNPVVGTSHTFTLTSVVGYPTLLIFVFKGADLTAPFDGQENGANGSSGTTLNTGSVTAANSNSLIVTGFGYNSASNTPTVSSPFSTPIQVAYNSGLCFGGSAAYLIESGSPTAHNPQWGWANTSDSAAGIACSKPAVASVSNYNKGLILQQAVRRASNY